MSEEDEEATFVDPALRGRCLFNCLVFLILNVYCVCEQFWLIVRVNAGTVLFLILLMVPLTSIVPFPLERYGFSLKF